MNKDDVFARSIWQELGMKKDYSTWFQTQIDRFGLLENVDYTPTVIKSDDPSGGRPRIEHKVTNRVRALLNENSRPQRTVNQVHHKYVYFLVSSKTGYLKVGYSCNPIKRLGRIKELSPFSDLALYGTIDGGYDKETEVHNLLSKYHSNSEWFYWNDESKAIVDQLIANKGETL